MGRADVRRALLAGGCCLAATTLGIAASRVGAAGRPPARDAGERHATRRHVVNLTVEVNGDILVHQPVWERARADGHGNFDFFPMLRSIAPYVRGADLAICHVETPMSPRPPQGYPVFNTPTQLARAIRHTGWRICDTASNHSMNRTAPAK